jgi:hypothetical protein
MHAERSASASRSPFGRSRVTNRPFKMVIDGRTELGRRRSLRETWISDGDKKGKCRRRTPSFPILPSLALYNPRRSLPPFPRNPAKVLASNKAARLRVALRAWPARRASLGKWEEFLMDGESVVALGGVVAAVIGVFMWQGGWAALAAFGLLVSRCSTPRVRVGPVFAKRQRTRLRAASRITCKCIASASLLRGFRPGPGASLKYDRLIKKIECGHRRTACESRAIRARSALHLRSIGGLSGNTHHPIPWLTRGRANALGSRGVIAELLS